MLRVLTPALRVNSVTCTRKAGGQPDTVKPLVTPRVGSVPRHERPHVRRVGSTVGSLLLTVLLAALLVLVSAVTVVPRMIGAVPLTVLTGSMQPSLDPGDLVVVRPTDTKSIVVGDVVTFQPVSNDPALVTHRVIEVRRDAAGAVSGFVTQGDANSASDDPIVPDQVMGRVVYSVPRIGYVTNAGGGPQLAVVAGVALLGYGLATVVISSRAERRAKKEERS